MALSMALALSAMAGQVVDRVVAKVNGHPILQSDWEQEVAFEAFSNARDPESFSAVERNAALDRLIDQELLRERSAVSNLPRPTRSLPGLPKSARCSRIVPPTRDGTPSCNVMGSPKARWRNTWATRSS